MMMHKNTSITRQQLIRRIHAQAREAGMDEETRRAGMLAQFGKNSIKDMDFIELMRVSDWLATRGGPVRRPGGGKPLSRDSQQRLLRGIWLEMHDIGVIRDPSDTALCSWLSNSRSPNVTTDLEFLDAAGTEAAINRIRAYRQRVICAGRLFCPHCNKPFRPTPAQARAWPHIACDKHEPAEPYQWRAKETA